MMRSLYSAVSGILAHQKSMDVIGNNIANVNTIGYKQGRTVFEDMFSQTLNPAKAGNDSLGGINPVQIGTGVSLAGIDNIFSQGAIKTTQRTMDIAIEGNGFFVVKAKNNATKYYTRAGDFNFDNDGFLTSPSGYIVQGWMADTETGEIQMNRPVGDVFLSRNHQIMPARETSEVVYNGVLGTEATSTMYTFTKMYTQAASVQTIFDAIPTNGGSLGLSSSDSVIIQAHATGITNAGNFFDKSGKSMALASNQSKITFKIQGDIDETTHDYYYSSQSGSDGMQGDGRFTTMQGLLDEINHSLESYGATAKIRSGKIEIESGDVRDGAKNFVIKSISSTALTEFLNITMSGLTGSYVAGDKSSGSVPTNRSSDYFYYRKVVSGTADFNSIEDLGVQIENAINGNVVSGGFNVEFMDNEFGMKDGQTIEATMTFDDGTTRGIKLIYRSQANDVPNVPPSNYIPYDVNKGPVSFNSVSQLVRAFNSFFYDDDVTDNHMFNGAMELNTTGGIDFRTSIGYNTPTSPQLEFGGGSAYMNNIFAFMNNPIQSNDPHTVREISANGKYSYSNMNVENVLPVGIYGYENGQRISVTMGRPAVIGDDMPTDATTMTFTYVSKPGDVILNPNNFNTYQQLVDRLNKEFDERAVFSINSVGSIIYTPSVQFNQRTDTLPTLLFKEINPAGFDAAFLGATKSLTTSGNSLRMPIAAAASGVLGLSVNETVTVNLTGGTSATFKYVTTVLNPATEFSTIEGLRDLINGAFSSNGIGATVSDTATGGLALNTKTWLDPKFNDIKFHSSNSALSNQLSAVFDSKGNDSPAPYALDIYALGLTTSEVLNLNIDNGTVSQIQLIAGTDFKDLSSLAAALNAALDVGTDMAANPFTVNATTGQLEFTAGNWGSVASIGLSTANTTVNNLLSTSGFGNIANSNNYSFSRNALGLADGDTITVSVEDGSGGTFPVDIIYDSATMATVSDIVAAINNALVADPNILMATSGLTATGNTLSMDTGSTAWGTFVNMKFESSNPLVDQMFQDFGFDNLQKPVNSAIIPGFTVAGYVFSDGQTITISVGDGADISLEYNSAIGVADFSNDAELQSALEIALNSKGFTASVFSNLDVSITNFGGNTGLTFSSSNAALDTAFDVNGFNVLVPPMTTGVADYPLGLNVNDTVSITFGTGVPKTFRFVPSAPGSDEFSDLAALATLIEAALNAPGNLTSSTVVVNGSNGLVITPGNWATVPSFKLSSSNSSVNTLLSSNGLNNVTPAGTRALTYPPLGLSLGETVSIDVLDVYGVPQTLDFTYGPTGDFTNLDGLAAAMNAALANIGAGGTFTITDGVLSLSTTNWNGKPNVTDVKFGSSNTDVSTVLTMFNTVTKDDDYELNTPTNIFGLTDGEAVTFDMIGTDDVKVPVSFTFTKDATDPRIGTTHFNTPLQFVGLMNNLIAAEPDFGIFSLEPNSTNPTNVLFTSGTKVITTIPGLMLAVKAQDKNGVPIDSIFSFLNESQMIGYKKIVTPQRDPDLLESSAVTGFSVIQETSTDDAGFNSNILIKQNTNIYSGGATFSERFLVVADDKTNMRNIFSAAGEYSFFVENQDFITFSAAINKLPVQTASSFSIAPDATIGDMMTFLEDYLGLGQEFNSVKNVVMRDGQVIVTGADGKANDITSLTAQGFQVGGSKSFSSGFGSPIKSHDASGGQYVRPMGIYDEQGNPHMVDFEFSMFNADKNEWALRLNVEDPRVSVNISGVVTNEVIIRFNPDGTPSYMYDRHANPVRVISNLTFELNPGNGARTVKGIRLNLGTAGERDGLTISNVATTMNIESQDGYEMGILSDMLFDDAGILQGYYSNGITRSVGKIAVATFQNNQGLQKVGDTMFRETVDSGMAAVGEAKSGSRGKIASSALEQSNVELSEEFVSMIVTERGFQANSRVVNTADEMIQELLNLKR